MRAAVCGAERSIRIASESESEDAVVHDEGHGRVAGGEQESDATGYVPRHHRRFLAYVHTHAPPFFYKPFLFYGNAGVTCRPHFHSLAGRLLAVINAWPQFHYSNSQWVWVCGSSCYRDWPLLAGQ